MKHITKPRDEDIEYVAANMRANDVKECEALGFTPLRSLTVSVKLSTVAYTLLDHQAEPVAILGVGMGLCPEWGAIWLLGTKGIEDNSMTFLRHSMPVLQRLYKESGKDVLYNYTHVDNELHHKWLKWLGFKFIRRTELGPYNESFYEFARLRG